MCTRLKDTALIFVLLLSCGSAIAAPSRNIAQEPPGVLAAVVPNSAVDKPIPSAAIFSQDAQELAEIIDIAPLYQQLKDKQQIGKKIASSGSQIEKLFNEQAITHLRTQINQCLLNANLELNSVKGALDTGMAQLADRKAVISDQRARVLRRNSFINLVSGGLTKIGGYSTALTDTTAIPTNVLEVLDGTVQTSLSALMIRQQRAEATMIKRKPLILMRFIGGGANADKTYPESVWRYLNQKTRNNKSRREMLREQWMTDGYLYPPPTNKGARKAPAPSSAARVTGDDIDDTIAMMSDLKSALAGMENSLMELSETIKNSYGDDPQFE